MTRTSHVILTRFNLPTDGVEGLIRAREGWLRERVALFERYTVPSVARQTRRVSWIVYLDPESPAWLSERLAPLVARGLFRPVHRTSVGPDDLREDLRATVTDPGEVLLTTNLDNDDALASDFSERVQAVVRREPKVVVYVDHGLIREAGGLYLRTDRRNAFCSVRESWDEPVTAWSEYHNEFPRTMPAVQLGGPPGWLQVVHGSNVSNRVRGRLVRPAGYRDRFPVVLDDVPDPTAREIVLDAALRMPARSARDGARAGLRVAGLRLLGKDRYQSAKLFASDRLGRRALGQP